MLIIKYSMFEYGERQQIPPIQYWFILRTAPDEIKQQWVDVPLPCRRPFIEGHEPHIGQDVGMGFETLKLIEDGVAIEADDAIRALMLFERHDAASWWDDYCGGMGATLVFRANEGQALPVSAAERILPGLSDFDDPRI